MVSCSEVPTRKSGDGGQDASGLDGINFGDGEPVPEAGRDGVVAPAENYFCGAKMRCWENPFPQGNTLNSVWVGKSGEIVFLGDTGTIIRFNGSEWSHEAPGSYELDILNVWSDDSGPVFAAGRFGQVIQKKNGDWAHYPQTVTEQALVAIVGQSANDLMFIGEDGDIAAFDGKGWSQTQPFGANAKVVTAWRQGAVTYIGGSALWRHDGSWSVIAEFGIRAIWGMADDNLFVVSKGKMHHFDGASWSKMPMEDEYPNGSPAAIWGSNSKNIFAAGSNGLIWRYEGEKWREMETPDGAGSYSGIEGAGDDVYAYGQCGRVDHFDGTSWSALSGGIRCPVRSIWVDKSGDAFAVCDYNNVLRRTSDGRWERMSLGSLPKSDTFCPDPPNPGDKPLDYCSQLRTVWGTASNLYVAGERGAVLHFDGSVWRKMDTGTDSARDAIGALFGFASDDVYATLNRGSILHYDGSKWTKSETGVTKALGVLWGTAPDDLWAGGEGGTILHYDGAEWTDKSVDDTHSMGAIWGSGRDDVWAVGRDAVFHYDGNTWERVEDIPGENRFFKGVWGTGKNDVFIVGDWGMVWHYNGRSWRRLLPGTDHILFTAAGHGKDIYLGGSCGTILHRSL